MNGESCVGDPAQDSVEAKKLPSWIVVVSKRLVITPSCDIRWSRRGCTVLEKESSFDANRRSHCWFFVFWAVKHASRRLWRRACIWACFFNGSNSASNIAISFSSSASCWSDVQASMSRIESSRAPPYNTSIVVSHFIRYTISNRNKVNVHAIQHSISRVLRIYGRKTGRQEDRSAYV